MNRRTDHRAVTTAINTIKEFEMVNKGDRVLISVSGGPDSVFLTRVFIMLRKDFKLRLYGFSLDHGTRDGQSGRDLEFVKEMYKELKIKLFTRSIDAAKWCTENNLSFQEGARIIRTDLLKKIAKDNNINRIALGHNLNDNIETFLMRIIRGAGARGLSGIRPVNGKLIRPLINTSRQDIEDYLEVNKISFRIDSSNLEDKYIRNRIRNSLIPFIRENFPGNIEGGIKRAVNILRGEDAFLRNYSTDILKKDSLFRESSDSKKIIYIKIPISKLNKYPVALKRRIVQAALDNILESLDDINYRNIEDILNLTQGNGENKWFKPLSSLMIFRIKDDIHIADTGNLEMLDPDIRSYILERSYNGRERHDSGEQIIKIGGCTRLRNFNLSVNASLIENPGDYHGLDYSRAVMDYNRVLLPVRVRNWLNGDKFYPLGMKGSKKLQDFFTDCKVPVNLRNKIPVFCDREKIIWIGNMRLDKRVSITPRTSEFLRLELFEK